MSFSEDSMKKLQEMDADVRCKAEHLVVFCDFNEDTQDRELIEFGKRLQILEQAVRARQDYQRQLHRPQS